MGNCISGLHCFLKNKESPLHSENLAEYIAYLSDRCISLHTFQESGHGIAFTSGYFLQVLQGSINPGLLSSFLNLSQAFFLFLLLLGVNLDQPAYLRIRGDKLIYTHYQLLSFLYFFLQAIGTFLYLTLLEALFDGLYGTTKLIYLVNIAACLFLYGIGERLDKVGTSQRVYTIGDTILKSEYPAGYAKL